MHCDQMFERLPTRKQPKQGHHVPQHHQGKNASLSMIRRHMWFELVREGDSEAEMFVGMGAI